MMRIGLVAAVVAVGLTLTGCAYQNFTRPLFRNYVSDAIYSHTRPPDARPTVPDDYRQQAQALGRWRDLAAEPDDYVVGPGDVIKLSVFAAERTDAGLNVDLLVDNRGTVQLPLVGTTEVGGLTLTQVADKVLALYREGYYRSPQATLSLSEYGSKKVYVTGAVAKPGFVVLKTNSSNLLEILLLAGGATKDAGGDLFLTCGAYAPADAAVSSGGLAVNLNRLSHGSDILQNILVLPGDALHVPVSRPQKVYVGGYVSAPGAYDLPSDRAVGMLDSVMIARGLTASARADKTVLLRQGADGEKRYYVNLVKVAAAKEEDIIVQPNDRIIVGTSATRRFIDGLLHVLGLRSLAPPIPAW